MRSAYPRNSWLRWGARFNLGGLQHQRMQLQNYKLYLQQRQHCCLISWERITKQPYKCHVRIKTLYNYRFPTDFGWYRSEQGQMLPEMYSWDREEPYIAPKELLKLIRCQCHAMTNRCDEQCSCKLANLKLLLFCGFHAMTCVLCEVQLRRHFKWTWCTYADDNDLKNLVIQNITCHSDVSCVWFI